MSAVMFVRLSPATAAIDTFSDCVVNIILFSCGLIDFGLDFLGKELMTLDLG